MIRVLRTGFLLVLAVGVTGACGTGESAGGTAESVRSAPPRPLPMQPGVLTDVDAAIVQGRVGPGGKPFEVTLRTTGRPGHDRRYGQLSLPTALRSAGLDKYPCTSCHIPGQVAVRADRTDDGHQNIQPLHPNETGASCATCHSARNVDRLVLQSGETATMDEPYRLCAQCHSPQVTAWAAGAHGKRLDGWHGRRVVMNCTDCHDPHRPMTQHREPFPGPILPRTGRKNQ
jgi:hypothetical protein